MIKQNKKPREREEIERMTSKGEVPEYVMECANLFMALNSQARKSVRRFNYGKILLMLWS